MEHFVITIARQYGSGGRTIGEALAKRLGVRYYDKNLIRLASDESGIDEAMFGRVDEHSRDRVPLFVRPQAYNGELISSPDDREFTSDRNLFNYQAKAIREVAGTSSCVIIGRCSNYILRDEPYVLRVFIHAGWAYRMERAAEKLSMSPKEIERFLKKDDRRKEEFSLRYTGHHWADATQYDLCLDSGRFGDEGCIEQIMKMLE